MKYLMSIFLLGASFAAPVAQANDIFWVELKTNYSYRDESLTCGDKTGFLMGPVFFMAVVNDAKQVTYAEFRSTDMAFPHKRIAFTKSEVEQIKVETEVLGDYYIKSLPLDARLSSWLIYNIDPFNHCRPLVALSSVTPDPAVINFTPKQANVYYGPVVKLEGTRVDGKGYEVKIGFWQNLLMNP